MAESRDSDDISTRDCQVYALLAAFALLFSHDTVAQLAANELKCVRVFDATFFEGKPGLGAYGMEPLRLVVALHWWPDRTKTEELPERADVAKWVASLKSRDLPLVIDLEHWPQKEPAAEIPAVVAKHRTLVDWVRAAGYEGRIGYYGIPPVRDYWRAIEADNSPARRSWVLENDRWSSLVDNVDLVFPSLYTFYEDIAGWEKYAISNLREARRLAGGKPVYAFLWPQFHNSNKKLAYGYLSAGMWSRELEVVAKHADGMVIWGGSDPKRKHDIALWDEQAGWWRATREFLAANHQRCRQPEASSKLGGHVG